MSKSQVSIVKTGSRPDYDTVLAAVRKSIDLIGGLDDVIKPGQMVLINPSWVAAPADPETGTCTWPEVSRAVADVVKAAGARAIIAESSAVGVDCEKVIKESGHAERVPDHGHGREQDPVPPSEPVKGQGQHNHPDVEGLPDQLSRPEGEIPDPGPEPGEQSQGRFFAKIGLFIRHGLPAFLRGRVHVGFFRFHLISREI